MVILKNNMKAKNPDLDRWITKLKVPINELFQAKSVHNYTGITENQAAKFLYAAAYNYKRVLVLDPGKPWVRCGKCGIVRHLAGEI